MSSLQGRQGRLPQLMTSATSPAPSLSSSPAPCL